MMAIYWLKNVIVTFKSYSFFAGEMRNMSNKYQPIREVICSSINDNWTRVEVMASVAKSFYAATRNTDFRNRIVSGGNLFPFDATAETQMSKESCIVGMLMAWSVVTLESMVNHALAQAGQNRLLSIMAIEYPAQVTDKLRVSRSARSELAKKLILLNEMDDQSEVPTALADKLADTRNNIVHDKPFRLIDYGEGDVTIDYFRSRKGGDDEVFRFEDLEEFFKDCDVISKFIENSLDYNVFGNSRIDFPALLTSCESSGD